MTPSLTETAIANGDTRTINLFYVHTEGMISATYLVNGQYDRAVLHSSTGFCAGAETTNPRKWTLASSTWCGKRTAPPGRGASHEVVSAYRSPQTNAMLRARSRAVAKYSRPAGQGDGHDDDRKNADVAHSRVWDANAAGGVGYYPTAGTPFVHLDVGSVRAWPRMSYEQLAQLFPDGKTVHLPSNGQPLARYEEAKAEIEARNNGAIVMAPRRSSGGFLAFLFGGGEDDTEDEWPATQHPQAMGGVGATQFKGGARRGRRSEEEGGEALLSEAVAAVPETLAERRRPARRTVMAAGPEDPKAAAAAARAAARAEASAKAEAAKAEAAAAKAEAAAAKGEAAERERLARAPMPPERPAALEKPTPLDAASAEKKLAALEPNDNVKLRGNLSETGQAQGKTDED